MADITATPPKGASINLLKVLGPVHVWALGVGIVLVGEFMGWNFAVGKGGALAALIACWTAGMLYTCVAMIDNPTAYQGTCRPASTNVRSAATAGLAKAIPPVSMRAATDRIAAGRTRAEVVFDTGAPGVGDPRRLLPGTPQGRGG
jgi:hypothetical protein